MRAARIDEVITPHTPAIVAALGAVVLVLAYWSFVRPPRNVVARAIVGATCAFTVTYALVTLEIDYEDPESLLCLLAAMMMTGGLLYEMRAAVAVVRSSIPGRRRQRVHRLARLRAAARAAERRPDRIAS